MFNTCCPHVLHRVTQGNHEVEHMTHDHHMLSTCSTQGSHEAEHMRQSTAMHSQCSVSHYAMRHLLTDSFLYISSAY